MISIDLGSNTFRCIEYDCSSLQWGGEFERIVKTADKMHATGRIDAEAVERIVAAIEEAKSVLDFASQPVKAVTTAAMRMAENAETVLEQIAERSGVVFDVIDAEQEALYTTIAVKNRLRQLDLSAEKFVLIDIGGGSTEVIFANGPTLQSQSFPLGIVTVAQQCTSPEEVRTTLQAMLVPVKEYVAKMYEAGGKPDQFVSTAGTPTTIASFLQGMTYDTYDVERINGYLLSIEACATALKGLLALDEQTRAEYVGVGRETLIVAGVVIVEEFYKLLGFETSVIVDDGVREGVAIDYCASSAQ